MTQQALPGERELPLAHAHARIHQDLNALGLDSHVQTLGHTLVNTRVNLSSSHNQRQGSGSGKGYTDTAQVGAYFEALEHYLTEHHGLDAPVEFHRTNSFTRCGALSDDSLLDLLIQDQQSVIACRRYSSPLDSTEFNYPIALSLPGYADNPLPQDTFIYTSLRRYCSNSGIAIGASWNEAVLHAINECIERDAVSLFLLKHFYYKHDLPLLLLERPPAGTPLANLWLDAEAELGTEIVVLDISNEFCATTYIAFTRPGTRSVKLFGAGTSLCAELALTRALTELVQVELCAQSLEVAQLLFHQERHLSAFPRLQRCLRLDTDRLLASARHHHVTLPVPAPQRPLAEQIRLLAQDIRQHQREVGVNVMYTTESGTTLVNVVIPGLERFYIVGSGNVVTPQARGTHLHAQHWSAHE